MIDYALGMRTIIRDEEWMVKKQKRITWGIKFQYVFDVAANNRIIPLAAAINHTDTISEKETVTAEKCLLYVALTRAQKGVYISGYGRMSQFLQSKGELQQYEQ